MEGGGDVLTSLLDLGRGLGAGLMLGPFPQGCRSVVSLKESRTHLRKQVAERHTSPVPSRCEAG